MELITHIALEGWNLVATMAPYLLFGFFIAGVLGTYLPSNLIEKHLGKRGLWQIVKASLLGIPIPLCSCSVIPVTASIRKHGATQGATISFLTSTPQTGVDSIAATWGLLGPLFSLARTVIAFITGILCGISVEALSSSPSSTQTCTDDDCPSCNPAPGVRRWKRVFTYGFGTLPRDISRSLLIGLLVSALLSALVPVDFFMRHLQTEWLTLLLVLCAGIPLYVCSTGSIPIALAMISMGLSPGAALVFLITGPATNAATIATVAQTMGARVVVFYIATLSICSIAAGLLLNRFLTTEIIAQQTELHAMSPNLLEQLSGLFLIALLLQALIPKKKKQCCCAH